MTLDFPSPDSPNMKDNENITLLLVDDDPAIQEGVVDLLKFYGYRILTASDGTKALDVMNEYTPDLIISDIMMPEMDGYEFYEAVRKNPEWTTIPFIFLTARGQQNDIRLGHQLGADAYVVKPFEPEDLVVAVQAKLKRIHEIKTATQADVDAMKNQLITIFSHELRTPLTYIYGYVNLLQESHGNMDSDSLDTMLDGVRRGAERLVDLVEDLMLMIRIDSGVVGMEIDHRKSDLPINAIIQKVIQSLDEYATSRQVTIETDISPDLTMQGVDIYLEDILTRILDNSIKFSDKQNGPVIIKAAEQENQILITVQDHGIGISPKDQQKIFERFTQVDRQLMEQQGIGLGLSLAKELVELHQGTIQVKSQPDEGTTITLSFPKT